MEWLRDHLLAVNLAPILKKMDAMGIKQMVIARGHGIVLQLTPAMGGKCIELPESLFTPPPPPR